MEEYRIVWVWYMVVRFPKRRVVEANLLSFRCVVAILAHTHLEMPPGLVKE